VVTACQYSSLILVDSFISFVFDLYTSLGACVVKCRAVHDAVLCLRCKACLHSVQSVRYTGAVPVDEAWDLFVRAVVQVHYICKCISGIRCPSSAGLATNDVRCSAELFGYNLS
jgi:hypothetical protein